MANRKNTGGRVQVTHREVDVERTRELEPSVATGEKKPYTTPALTKLPVVDKGLTKCPHCGFTRSRVLRTRPGDDGRMDVRLCLGCAKHFNAWDPSWRR